eukprot:778171-Amphidinium_carterae.1
MPGPGIIMPVRQVPPHVSLRVSVDMRATAIQVTDPCDKILPDSLPSFNTNVCNVAKTNVHLGCQNHVAPCRPFSAWLPFRSIHHLSSHGSTWIATAYPTTSKGERSTKPCNKWAGGGVSQSMIIITWRRHYSRRWHHSHWRHHTHPWASQGGAIYKLYASQP